MERLKGCLSLIVVATVAATVVHAIWGDTALVGLIAGPIAILALYILYVWVSGLRGRHKFLRTAPGRVQECMAVVKDSLAAGAHHLETAEQELESGIAPLFWDAMDNFPPAIEQSRTAWNVAVDIAERYYKHRRSKKLTPLMPEASLPAVMVELGDKWLNLRRQSLANQHFASIFEQRRQADKIADHLRKQKEQVETAIDAARRAALVASQALSAAEQAKATAKQANARARSAGAAARRASWSAASAQFDANDAKSVANAVWSKI